MFIMIILSYPVIIYLVNVDLMDNGLIGIHKNTPYIQPTDTEYPYTIFKGSLQNFRNPIKRCCHACALCPLLETRCFVESTVLKHKFPICQPHPKQFFNCQTSNVIYLIICKIPGCGAQYVGYTARPIICRESDGPMIKHIKETNTNTKKIRFQILAQAPTNKTNTELWSKR